MIRISLLLLATSACLAGINHWSGWFPVEPEQIRWLEESLPALGQRATIVDPDGSPSTERDAAWTGTPARRAPDLAGRPDPRDRAESNWAEPNWAEWARLPVAARESLLRQTHVLQVRGRDQTIQGQVLGWDDRQMVMISRRGRLHYLSWAEQTAAQALPGPFRPLGMADMQRALVAEFGPEFVVRTATDFIVVQPRHSRLDWSRIMQQFLGNIQTYCSLRNMHMTPPRFPLVAIVLPTRAAMQTYARQHADSLPANFQAYYSLNSNRVVMYDPVENSAQPADSTDVSALDLATVFHEAFHQAAFNTGIHYRTAPPPTWLSEGLATAFESPGLSDHLRSKSIADRRNLNQWRLFQDYSRESDFLPTLIGLIRSDELFRTDPNRAYSLSWALAFYWLETSPQAFSQYLQRVNRRPAFSADLPDKRERDFLNLTQCSWEEFYLRLANFHRQKP